MKKEQKRTINNQKTTFKMSIHTQILIVTLNINGLDAPIKRYRVAEQIKKQDPYICCLKETHFRSTDAHRLKVRGWKKVFHTSANKKKAGWQYLYHTKQT